MFVSIEEVFSGKHNGKEVSLRGWVYRKREQKEIDFVILRDSTGLIQLAAKNNPQARKSTIESSIEATGIVKEDGRAPGGYEIQVKDFRIIGLAETFPIGKDLGEEFLRDVRHLWLRSPKMTAIMRIRSNVIRLVNEWFLTHGYKQVSPPMFVSGACEGGSTLFELKYFDKKAFLTQSWQLYAEAMIYSLEKIYTISPSFRAEKSRTIRHLTEYWHIECEQAFSDMDDIMKVEEQLVSHICQSVAQQNRKELEILEVDYKKLANVYAPFERITYDDAIKILQGKRFNIRWGDDFGYDEEKTLAEEFGKPFFVYAYPKKIKAFYCKIYSDNPKLAMSVDMMVPKIGEISTGGSRVDDKKELIERMREFDLDPKDYEWYVDLRKYGTVPHAGFGLGLERLLAWMLNLNSIFDAIPFPRTMARIYP